MLKNYFKIAWRNISRRKVYTAINILGLAFGICACIAIYLVGSFELSFDKFHPDKDRIYRIVGDMERASGEKRFLNCPILDAAGIQRSVPGFETTAGLHLYNGKISIPGTNNIIKKFDNRIDNSYQSTSIITWPSYFDVFIYQWLAGNAQSLNEPWELNHAW